MKRYGVSNTSIGRIVRHSDCESRDLKLYLSRLVYSEPPKVKVCSFHVASHRNPVVDQSTHTSTHALYMFSA